MSEKKETGAMSEEKKQGPATVTRRRAMGLAAGAAAATVVPARMLMAQDLHGHVAENAAAAGDAEGWTPEFFSEEEMKTIAAIADLIIPRTETPGAIDAGVPRYIDKAIAVERDFFQKRIRKGIEEFEEYCREAYGGAFYSLTAEQQREIMAATSDENEKVEAAARKPAKFVADVKTRTLDGYYTSREGLIDELGRTTKMMFPRYRGCTHSGDEHPVR